MADMVAYCKNQQLWWEAEAAFLLERGERKKYIIEYYGFLVH